MEQRYNPSKIDLSLLRDYCERQGERVDYKKGEQMERKGEPARWVGFVECGCFKYTVRRSIDGRVNDLPLYAIASFLGVTSKTLSKLRRNITFGQE